METTTVQFVQRAIESLDRVQVGEVREWLNRYDPLPERQVEAEPGMGGLSQNGRSHDHAAAAGSRGSISAPKHISRMIREEMSDVSEDVLAAMPRDGSYEHDHYIYGTPKRRA